MDFTRSELEFESTSMVFPMNPCNWNLKVRRVVERKLSGIFCQNSAPFDGKEETSCGDGFQERVL